MSFSEAQDKALKAKLNGKYVKTREQDGKVLSYVEGWHVIAEANRIFGFDAWDRETVHAACVWEGASQGLKACSYVARVRVRVRAGDTVVVREASGSGHGCGAIPGEAHESAIKEAETDAMKRALVTFGNPFGLALYDGEQRGVRRGTRPNDASVEAKPISWMVVSSSGEPVGRHHDPIAYCSDIRKHLERCDTADNAMEFWRRNQEALAQLRKTLPELTNEKGQHYVDILGSLLMKRLQAFAQEGHSNGDNEATKGRAKAANKGRIQLNAPRRVRDKEHLRHVAEQPCLVCGRQPSQAHHLRHAQPRALGLKPSDEWVVPLCATHHRALHDFGDERRWWKAKGIDALKEAGRLWSLRRGNKQSA